MSIINCINPETVVWYLSEVYSLKVVLLHNVARRINKILNTHHTTCLMAWLDHCWKLLMEIFQLWFVHLVHTVCLLSSFSNQRAKLSGLASRDALLTIFEANHQFRIMGSSICRLLCWSTDLLKPISRYHVLIVLLIQANGLFATCFCYKYWLQQ